MATLSGLFAPAEGSGGGATIEESLPTFFLHSAFNGNQGSYAHQGIDSYGNQIWGGYSKTDSEGYNNWGSAPVSTYYSSGGYGYITSNSENNWNWNQATPNCQSEGHYRYCYPSNSIMYGNSVKIYTNSTNNFWPYFGTTISNFGKRMRMSMFMSSTTMSIYRRGAYMIESLGVNSSTFLQTGGPGTSTSGMISYNERTSTLAMIWGDTSNNYRLHVWKHPGINLNAEDFLAGQLYLFLSEARSGINGASYFYNDFSWSTSGSSSYNESRFHNRIIMGDNGRIGLVRMTPSNQTVHAWIQPNPSSTSLSAEPTTISTMSLTTSYGIEQGNAYGMRSMMDWSNRFLACYSPYYYYGSGINCHFVSTENPSIGYQYQYSDTQYGINVFPMLKTGFGWRIVSQNTNTTDGIYIYKFDPSEAYDTGFTNGSAISNGGTLNATDTYLPVDVGYTSTNYPTMGPLGSWKKVG